MTEKKEIKKEKTRNLAVIRIRGMTGVRKEISDTLKMLNLNSKFSCVVVPKNESYEGMVKKAKDFITWGEIDSQTLKKLKEKREEQSSQAASSGKPEKEKKVFRLSPPRGGFERKGTKKAFRQGGALGYRKDKINDLIKKMV
ncbi:50S ribosomal protein L30 [Candidatus Woesearchaeota archaeon]|nr:50S ribosomal protein L30 [Candidatus Woesearchaeota archaeon]